MLHSCDSALSALFFLLYHTLHRFTMLILTRRLPFLFPSAILKSNHFFGSVIMLEFVIPCLLGLESLVGDEIRKLGLSDVRVENGRVLCRGEARDIARLNINLRCGARVILVLHKFRATDFESLFQGVRAVHWEDWIPREGEFPVVGYSINSTLHSVPACQSIVKKIFRVILKMSVMQKKAV